MKLSDLVIIYLDYLKIPGQLLKRVATKKKYEKLLQHQAKRLELFSVVHLANRVRSKVLIENSGEFLNLDFATRLLLATLF